MALCILKHFPTNLHQDKKKRLITVELLNETTHQKLLMAESECVSPSPSSRLFSTLRAITQTLPSCINAWLKGNFFWEVRRLLYVNFGKKHSEFPEYGYRRPHFSTVYAYLYRDTVNCVLVEHILLQECYVFTTSRKDLSQARVDTSAQFSDVSFPQSWKWSSIKADVHNFSREFQL